MHRTTKHLLRAYIKTAEELAPLLGITPDGLQRRARRGTADFVKKGRHTGLMLLDVRDFREEIERSRNSPNRNSPNRNSPNR